MLTHQMFSCRQTGKNLTKIKNESTNMIKQQLQDKANTKGKYDFRDCVSV